MIRYTIGRNLAVSGDRIRLTRKSTKVVSILNWQSIYIWIESIRKIQQAALTRLNCSNLFFVKKWEKNRIIINNVLHRNYPNIPMRKDSKKWARRHRLITLIRGRLPINLLRFLILKKRMLGWCLKISA